MKLSGRLIIYGEYLMHDLTEGLVVPSASVLASEDEPSLPFHRDFDLALDTNARALEALGYRIRKKIRGDLPLGYGLAGGSVLTYLHLTQNGYAPDPRLMNLVDATSHGFLPSGVDVEAAWRQRPGLFGRGMWRDLSPAPILTCSLLLFEKEGREHLTSVRKRVLQRSEILVRLADAMTRQIRASRELPYSVFLEYCQVVRSCDVYSDCAASAADYLLARGIAAKGVGGLYDKALLIVWPDTLDSDVILDRPAVEALRWLPRA